MKKVLWISLVAVLTLATMLVLFACDFEVSADIEYEGAEAVNQAGRDFYAETIEQTNVKIVIEQGGEVVCTIQKDGDKVSRTYGRITGYAYIDNGRYYGIADPDDMMLYTSATAKEDTMIEDTFYAVKRTMDDYLTVSPLLYEGESNYTATLHAETKGDDSVATLDMTIAGKQKNYDETLMDNSNHVVAKSTNGLIESIVLDKLTDGVEAHVQITVTYGDASVTLPDTHLYSVIDLDAE